MKILSAIKRTIFASLTASLLISIPFTSNTFAGGDGNPIQKPGTLDNAPDCLSGDGSLLAVDDNAAIALKTTSANGSTSRAHVQGPITKIYPNETGHNHFEISLGDASGDTLEVVYDFAFGTLPTLELGMTVEACGDFINSYAPEKGYQASPDGALIHWIHRTNSSHPAGFTIVNGVLYGQGSGSES